MILKLLEKLSKEILVEAKIHTYQFNNLVNKYYPDLSIEEAENLVQLDPTFENDTTGLYFKWILSLANKGKITNENKDKVATLLTDFHTNKSNLVNKDIMQYKTLDELENMLDDDASYRELSHRQQVRQRQKARRNSDMEKEADKVYEDDKWIVWIPRTYAASCKLGQGTEWCTASTENDFEYNKYVKKGPLYIIINKKNPQEKYQFHFQTKQFMNRDDFEIDINEFLNSERNLYNFFVTRYPNDIIDLSKVTTPYIYDGQEIPKELKPYIEEVIIPSTVEDIKDSAFNQCSYITKITIQDGVKRIGDHAFYQCSHLVSIAIPSSVSVIGRSAFNNCSRLKEVILVDGLLEIGEKAFNACALENMIIPDSVINIGKHAFSNCNNLISVVISNNVLEISPNMFDNCQKLKTVRLGNNVEIIRKDAFLLCLSLPDILIPDSVKQIDQDAFAFCMELETISITDNVTEIGENAFYKCTKLTIKCPEDSYAHIYARKNKINFEIIE